MKLSGLNQKVDWAQGFTRFSQEEHTMVVGIDVSYSLGSVPVAAIVASMDKDLSLYDGEIALVRPQPTRGPTDVIDEMALFDSFSKLLTRYQSRNQKLPKKIIIYRDGVSDGQLQNTMNLEVRAIKDAFKRLSRGGAYSGASEPKITYVVCQKRHNIRFRDTSSDHNVPSGTIIDKGSLVHPSYFG